MISMFGAKTILDESKVVIRVKMSYDALYQDMFHHFGSYISQRNWFLVVVFLYIWVFRIQEQQEQISSHQVHSQSE